MLYSTLLKRTCLVGHKPFVSYCGICNTLRKNKFSCSQTLCLMLLKNLPLLKRTCSCLDAHKPFVSCCVKFNTRRRTCLDAHTPIVSCCVKFILFERTCLAALKPFVSYYVKLNNFLKNMLSCSHSLCLILC